MLSPSDFFDPVEWGRSFIGDGLPPGPDDPVYSGLHYSKDWYMGNLDIFFDAYRNHGPVFTIRMMGMKVVFVIGAKANQLMYVDKWDEFYWWGKSIEGHLAGLLGEGLLSSVDEKHDKARRLLDPVFSKTNLKKYVKDMVEITENQVVQLEDDEVFDFYDWVYDLALLNAGECFVGMEADEKKIESLHEHFDNCVQYFQLPIIFQPLRGPGTPHRSFLKSREKVDEILREEIERRRKKGQIDNPNILDRLLEAEDDGETFSNKEILDQIKTLYWAGHDTTISAISWLIMLIGKHKRVYNKIKDELKDRVGNQPITVKEVTDGLPYLEMAMDEALRLYPPAWIAFRKSREDFSIYGHDIPAGTDVAFSSLVTHRLPHLFEDPEAFRPERMDPDKKRDFPDGAYIPFARGPRTCIGMNFAKYEIKLIVATLLRHFDFELVPGQKFQGYPVTTLTPDEVKIRLTQSTSQTNGGSVPISNQNSGQDPQDAGADSNGCPVHDG